ncbi:phage holin family protein [Castellaniella sp.]|uniref:phage holin family protein n=1 Tax=Castellaniella sp. TaxID=1955812 RepID=UPI00356179F2
MGSITRAFVDVAHHVAALAGTRLELFGLEALEARDRLLQRLAVLLAAALCLFLALLVVTLTVALLFWPTPWRFWALGLMALAYALAGLALAWWLVHKVRHDPPPFATTAAVLGEDTRALVGLHARRAAPGQAADDPEDPPV